jgi:hypothetical protein
MSCLPQQPVFDVSEPIANRIACLQSQRLMGGSEGAEAPPRCVVSLRRRGFIHPGPNLFGRVQEDPPMLRPVRS